MGRSEVAVALTSVRYAVLTLLVACCGCATLRGGPGALPPLAWGRPGGPTGNGPGEFHNPRAAAVDAEGRLYVVDAYNRRVQVFDADGRFVAAWPADGYLGGGIAVDGAGRVIVSRSEGELVVHDRDGRELVRWGGKGREPGQFEMPGEVAVDRRSGLVYVEDRNNNRIQVLDAEGGVVDVWEREFVGGMAVDPAGRLYTIVHDGRNVVRRAPDGSVERRWPLDNGDPDRPVRATSIAVDGDGGFFVTDSSTRQVLRHDPDGQLLACWGGFGDQPGQLSGPRGLALAPDGNLYVVDDHGNHRVSKFTTRGRLLAEIGKPRAAGDALWVPGGLFVGRDGWAYVTDSNRVKVFRPDGTLAACWGGLGDAPGRFHESGGIAAAGDRIYVTDVRNNRVQVLNRDGEVLDVWERHFERPSALTLDPDGNILLLDAGRERVRRLGPEGQWLGSITVLEYAVGVAADADGNVYVICPGADTVQVKKYAPDGRPLLAWGRRGDGRGELERPTDIACGPDGLVYVVDLGNERIQRFTADGEYRGQWRLSGDGPGERRLPYKLALRGDDILVADRLQRQILRRPLSDLFAP